MRSTYDAYRAEYLCIPGGSIRSLTLLPARDSIAANNPAPAERPAEITCTIAERRASVGCYVFMEDGTWWIVYDRCLHGISETTPMYHPRVELTNEPPAVGAAAVQ